MSRNHSRATKAQQKKKLDTDAVSSFPDLIRRLRRRRPGAAVSFTPSAKQSNPAKFVFTTVSQTAFYTLSKVTILNSKLGCVRHGG